MRSAVLFIILILAIPAVADTIVWGVQDLADDDTQLFELNITTGWYQEIGPLHTGTDVESCARMDTQIVAYQNEDETPQEFIEMNFTTGEFTMKNNAPYTGPMYAELRGMATDGSGTVWGYADDWGFVTVDSEGDCTLMVSSESINFEGLGVNFAGTMLYGICDDGELYEVNVSTSTVTQIADLPGSDVENLEMVSDTEVSYFTDDAGGITYWTYDIVSLETDSLYLSGVLLSDIEGFLYVEQGALEPVTWGAVKASF